MSEKYCTRYAVLGMCLRVCFFLLSLHVPHAVLDRQIPMAGSGEGKPEDCQPGLSLTKMNGRCLSVSL